MPSWGPLCGKEWRPEREGSTNWVFVWLCALVAAGLAVAIALL